ncbi:MAG TPA: hypothetical protein VGL53_05465 [Bryobacteraceae bacterium]|jgi:hypothetical protein
MITENQVKYFWLGLAMGLAVIVLFEPHGALAGIGSEQNAQASTAASAS